MMNERDLEFMLYELFDSESLVKRERYQDHDRQTFNEVINTSKTMAEKLFLPIRQKLDTHQPTFDGKKIHLIPELKTAYDAVIDSGIASATADYELSGMQLPPIISSVANTYLTAAGSTGMGYVWLTSANCNLLQAHGSQELIDTWVKPMRSGRFAGTMAMTEPGSGSGLGDLTTKAIKHDDGTYRISGSKIFISGGDHNLSENIVHLVLARLQGAPKGVKGISLFVVPKFLLKDDGSLGARNTVTCGSIEHKMGIKGSATCVMNFDTATGFLVGEENKGLNYMFTMMNYERLGMGIQGVGAAETSYQQAAEYAIERIQGRSATGVKSADKKADSLIVHPDVRKMLLTMRAFNEGGRCFSTYVAKQLDIVKFSVDDVEKQQAEALVALLTPVAKAFMTDMAYESCNLGQMVFGGHGYVREWGQEQLVRDVRIAQIYEGTNGIQALDLLGRKVVANKGKFLDVYFTEITTFIDQHANNQALTGFVQPLAVALEKLKAVTGLIIAEHDQDKNMVGASASDYLAAFGLLSYAYMWALMAEKSSAHKDEDFYQAKLYVGVFFNERLLPRIDGHIHAIEAGSKSLMAMPESLFNYNH